jgi:hypothetical protein
MHVTSKKMLTFYPLTIHRVSPSNYSMGESFVLPLTCPIGYVRLRELGLLIEEVHPMTYQVTVENEYGMDAVEFTSILSAYSHALDAMYDDPAVHVEIDGKHVTVEAITACLNLIIAG